MIAFIHGPDALLVRTHLAELLATLDPDGSNTTRVDGKTTTPQAIGGMVATPSFFGMARVVVVDDLFARASKDGDDEESDEPASSKKRSNAPAIELLSQVVEPNALILVEPTLSSVPAAVKKSGAGITIHPGIPPRGKALQDWAEERARALGTTFDGGPRGSCVAELLNALAPGSWQQANRNPAYDVPPDLDRIQQEIAKLATYSHPGPITSQAIQTMTLSGTADQLFPLLSSLFRGNPVEAVRLFADAIDMGEDHFRLLAQIYGQVELSPPLEASRSVDPEVVGREIGLPNPKRMAVIAQSTRSRPMSNRVAAVTAVDRGQKTGELRTTDDVLFALLDIIAR